ncbi:MAG: carboxypeptidase-like regulatory domain-containing protein [Bacteroidia bacterium]|nr:carboxypeptidase-like regulatory domain-containing protein [Bacteroidia bacterium]
MRNILCVLALQLLFFTAAAQSIRGRVFNRAGRVPLAFVTVVEEGSQNGTYSDIDGYFSLKLTRAGSALVFSCLGFETQKLPPPSDALWIVEMAPASISMKEVVILPGDNPAEVIMRRVLQNKKRNDPERALSFTYDSYNKLVFAGVPDTTSREVPQVENSLDTALVKKKDYFDDKHLFLLESASHRKHLPPGKDEEQILATRVSGLKNPAFALLGTQLQSFSLYGDNVSILDLQYLSPLNDAAISKYLFILEDSSVMHNATVYTIRFLPRKNKKFNGLKGTLFINSDGWALQNVLAEPADSAASVGIRIQQQYSRKEGVWFPEQLNSFLSIPGMQVNGVTVTGISKSYIRNLNIQPSLRKRDFGPVVLRMAPRATQVPDSVWNQYREHALDPKEQQTYVYMDSVGKAENFEQKIKVLGILASGKLPLGPVSFDINRLIRMNDYEGLRLGAGLHTNDFLSERFSIGGYYAYGFKDKAHKYGGDVLVHLYRRRSAWIQLRYEDDVLESGGRQLDPRPGTFLNTNYYPFFISRMDHVTLKEVSLNGRLIGNLSATLFANEQETEMYRDLGFLYPRTEEADLIIRRFTLQQAGITLRWAPGEQLAVAGQREVSMGGKWPVFYFRYALERIDELDRLKQYERVDAMVEKTFRSTLYGDFILRALGGYVPEALPLSLYYNARGTNTINYDRKRYIGIAAPNTFETMRTNEFMHSAFLAVHVRHQFRDLLFRSKNFRPQLSIVSNMLWGRLTKPEQQLHTGRVASRGYFESGLCIDRLLHSGFSGFGLAVFYRYGAYALEKKSDNIVVKLSVSFGS